MIKILTLLLFFSFQNVFAESKCMIQSYKEIIKINKILDSKIIKSSTCSSEINQNYISLVSNAEGRVHSKFLANQLQKVENVSIELSPKVINISNLIDKINDKFSETPFTISKITSLYGNSSLYMDSPFHFEISCTNCNDIGEKSLKLLSQNKTIWLNAEVSKSQTVYISNTELNYRTPLIQKSDFTKQTVLNHTRSNAFTNIDHIQFYKLNKNISSGDILKNSDVSPKKLISFGQQVKLTYSNSSISLNTYAKAKKDGFFGDYIELENIKSKRKFLGKVVGFNSVVVDL